MGLFFLFLVWSIGSFRSGTCFPLPPPLGLFCWPPILGTLVPFCASLVFTFNFSPFDRLPHSPQKTHLRLIAPNPHLWSPFCVLILLTVVSCFSPALFRALGRRGKLAGPSTSNDSSLSTFPMHLCFLVAPPPALSG